jgi:hypothetical protein
VGTDPNFPQCTTAAKFPEAAHDALGLDSFLTPEERNVKQRVRGYMVGLLHDTLGSQGAARVCVGGAALWRAGAACHMLLCWRAGQPRAAQLTARASHAQEAKVAPIIADFWERAEFPHELVAGLGELGVGGANIKGAHSCWARPGAHEVGRRRPGARGAHAGPGPTCRAAARPHPPSAGRLAAAS